MKRFVFDNLVYRISDTSFLIMNLISFRREVITEAELEQLILMEGKRERKEYLSAEEENFLQKFYDKKQILPAETVKEVDRRLEKNSELQMLKFPVKSITFNLTHSCNFNCEYCYQRKYKKKPKYAGNMSVRDIDAIMEYLRLPYFDDILLDEIVVSGGESLLPSNIDTINDICERVAAKKKTLFTNGINILAYKDKVNLTAFDEYQISLDGPDSVIRLVNRCGDSFAQIIGGIKYLQQMHKTITLVTMWTKELRSYLTEYLNLLKSSDILDQPGTTVKFVLVKDYYADGGLDKDFYSWEEVAADRKAYNPILSAVGSYLELLPEMSVLAGLLHRPVNERKNIRYKRCDLTKTVPMVFEPNGDIYWCLCLDGENGKIGNYKEKFFDRDKVLKLGNRTIFKVEQCRQCRLRYLCGGGCMLPLTSGEGGIYRPACGPFGEPFVWEHLEEFI